MYETRLYNIDSVRKETIHSYFASFGVCVRILTYHVVQIHDLYGLEVDVTLRNHFLTHRDNYPVVFMKGKGYICMVLDSNGHDVHVIRGDGCVVA